MEPLTSNETNGLQEDASNPSPQSQPEKTKEPRKPSVTISLTEELKEKLDTLAELEERNVGGQASLLFRTYIAPQLDHLIEQAQAQQGLL